MKQSRTQYAADDGLCNGRQRYGQRADIFHHCIEALHTRTVDSIQARDPHTLCVCTTSKRINPIVGSLTVL